MGRPPGFFYTRVIALPLRSPICDIMKRQYLRKPVIPNCKLELNIEAIRSHGKVWKYKGEAFVEGNKMADAQWSATIVDRK